MKHLAIKIFLAAAAICAPALAMHAENRDDAANRYRRSSLCSILVRHSEDKFADSIQSKFVEMPTPDKYNDLNLNIKVVSVDKKGKYENDIHRFVEDNHIASRLLARWFNRDILTGECDNDFLLKNAFINATPEEYELARHSARGINAIADASFDELIGNTYLMMNEVTYIDKNKRARTWGLIGAAIVGGLMAYGGASSRDIQSTMQSVNDIISSVKGFAVKIHTRLYRLVWDDEAQAIFYNEYWTAEPDEAKRLAFEKNRGRFHMEYVGDVISKGGTTSFLGINEDEPGMMINKACIRAIDDNVADLQKKYPQFRIKTPITSVDPTIQAQIGLKEGITKDSRFEVLEAEEKDGKITYKRVGVVRPVPTRIWDNRFMAQEEMAYGADFGATTFVKVSGGDLYPGLLLREINK